MQSISVAVRSAELIGRSFQATNRAFVRLEAAGVIRQITIGRPNREFEVSAVIDAFAALDRQLASPSGDTRAEPPRRAVPRRSPT